VYGEREVALPPPNSTGNAFILNMLAARVRCEIFPFMAEAPRYLTNRWTADLDDLFHPEDREDVLDWLVANHGRKRVMLVGSGFS